MDAFSGRTPQHIGFIVDDIEKTLAGVKALGLPVTAPDRLSISSDEIDHGHPAELRIGFARLGTLLAEFIEPPGGNDIWSRALAARGPGVHHVAFGSLDDYDRLGGDLAAEGFELTVAGHFGDDHWCYLERDGVVLELASGVGPQPVFDGLLVGGEQAK